jgi:hypothetical protein
MYKIVGADQREYGPVSQEEVLQWIAQGRANAATIARVGDGAWKPLGTFDEFKAALSTTGTAPPLVSGTFPTIPPTAMGAAPKANSSAIAALVFGILGLLCCPCIGPLVAIILGVSGLNQIKANPRAYTTDTSLPKIAIGLGITGLVLAVLQLLYFVFGAGISVFQELFK